MSVLTIVFPTLRAVGLPVIRFAERRAIMLFDMDFDGDVDVFDNVTEFMLANGELTGDEDSDDDGWWDDSDSED